jgi:uncharacterized protein
LSLVEAEGLTHLRVLVTGSSGFIGRELTRALAARGDEVVRAVRRAPMASDEVQWDPLRGYLRLSDLGIEGAVNLAGRSVGGRWSAANKERILRSRVDGTRFLAKALSRLEPLPTVLLSASAIGFYGDRGDEWLTEQSPPGSGFLAGVCRQWEAATEDAEGAGVRVVKLRTGVVLSSEGGLLPYLLHPARLGLSLRLGPGTQFLSWLGMPDEVGAIIHCLDDVNIKGPINLTSPYPVTQTEFAERLVAALKRGRVTTVPQRLLELVLGAQKAQEALGSSARALPKGLLASGYRFSFPYLADALQAIVDRLGRREA